MRIAKLAFTVFITIMLVELRVFAQKDFNPEYEKIKPRNSFVPGINVTRGETQLIVPERESVCPNGVVFKYNNGDIHVHDRRSSDGGKTWNKFEHILEPSTYQYPEPDGEVVMFKSFDIHNYESDRGVSSAGRYAINILKVTNQEGVFEARFFRSNDNGLTRVEETAKIYIPPEEFKEWRGGLCRKIVRISDGSLLMTTHGNSTILVIRSTDRGRTWHYYSTIVFDLRSGVRHSICEPTLLVLPNDKVLCFMRSGSTYQGSLGSSNNNDPSIKVPFGYFKSTPIYMSISNNGGRTWSIADPITPFGVWPDAVLMKNGIIAVNYGRPGNWLMFSKDEGESWGPIIPFYNDLYPPDCGNYFSMIEVAPDILLVVYARTDPNDHWKSEIVGTYFKVKRLLND